MTEDKTPELKLPTLKQVKEEISRAQGCDWLEYIDVATSGGIVSDTLEAVKNLTRPAEAQEQKGETIDTFKLPFDVQLGNNTFGKGVSFKTYADAANRYYGYAIEKPTPEPQEQKGCVAHAWPNLDKSTDRKCMTCGMIERDDIRQKQAEAFKNIPTPEPQGAEVAEAVATSKLKEAFGMFLNGLAYYETFPDNAEDAAQLRKAATYNFMRAARHINEELSDLCSSAAKAVYVTEHEAATRQQDSEKHRNDLMDKIVAQKTEIGALRAQIESQQDGRVDALVAHIQQIEAIAATIHGNANKSRAAMILAICAKSVRAFKGE